MWFILALPNWWCGVVVASVASIVDGLSLTEIRLGGVYAGMFANMFSSGAALLAVPILSPVSLTACGGFGMVVVVFLADAATARTTKVAAFGILAGVLMVTVDAHALGEGPINSGIHNTDNWLFFLLLAATSMFCWASSRADVVPPRIVGWIQILGVSSQAIMTLSFVYRLFELGEAQYFIYAVISAIIEIRLAARSVEINPIGRHMPSVFALWQIGVVSAAPFVSGKHYVTTWLSHLGILICTGSAILLVRDSNSKR